MQDSFILNKFLSIMNRFRILIFTLSVSFVVLLSCNSQDKPGNKEIENRVDSVSYSFGISYGQRLQGDFKRNGLDTVIDNELLIKGLVDLLKGNETDIDIKLSNVIINKFIREYKAKTADAEKLKAEKNLAEGRKFLEENKKKEGIAVLESGLQYKILVEGKGESPGLTDKVTTHYHGTLIDGTVFDSSVERGEPIQFPVNGVIKGWTEALQLMKVGSKWQLFIPSELAYGMRGAGADIGPNMALIFEVELISVDK